MPRPVKKWLVKGLIVLLQALKFAGRALAVALSYGTRPFVWFWRLALRKVVFLAYRLLVKFRIASKRAGSSAGRTFSLLFGRRYIVHGMMALLVLFVSAKNLYARETDHEETSRSSLIYRMVQSPEEIVFTETRFLDPSESYLNQTPESGTDAGLFSYDQSGVVKPLPLGEDGAPAPSAAEEVRERVIEPKVYVVRSGDTVSGIAQAHGISINTVLWANHMTARSVIRPGQELTILPVTGAVHTVKRGETLGAIARTYGSEVEKIMESNGIASAARIQIGQKLVIPDGRPPVPAAPKYTAPTRIAAAAAEVFSSPSEAPKSAAAEVGSLVWPTDSKRINQYFWWKHPGLDIHGRLENAVYAVDDGTVTTSGWNSGGYGNMIMIDHGNGTVTRYAHNSKHFVQAGEQVSKGQAIAMIGSTGRSTGPHLHFELYVNGRRVNPLNYYK